MHERRQFFQGEPQRIKGSTRLEAKKQRRRDGRDAGRRRPVVTEAEFLARRESVDRQMIVRSKDGRIQIGVLEEALSNFHRYFFIMPTLARFELELHERAEAGKPGGERV